MCLISIQYVDKFYEQQIVYSNLSKNVVNKMFIIVENGLAMQQFVDYNLFVTSTEGSDIMESPLRQKRKKMMLTQRQVADQLGIRVQTYSHYETKKRQPRIELMRKIADLFNSSLDELFF